MRAFIAVVLISLVTPRAGRATSAPLAADAEAAFDRYVGRKQKGVVFLGFSPDGRRFAFTRGDTDDGSGFPWLEAVEAEVDGGRKLRRYVMRDWGDEPTPAQLRKERRRYDAFLARVAADGISTANARAWTVDGGRHVSPDGALSIRWRVGRPRTGEEDTAGRVFAATLDDGDDHAVLFELFAGRGTDGVQVNAAPRLRAVHGTADGTGVVVVTEVEGRAMCWESDSADALSFAIAKIRAGRAARQVNGEGMARYAAGDHEGARALFARAVELDPTSPRARYNLAAVTARLGKPRRAIELLGPLARANPRVLAFKIATDPDFASTRTAEPMSAFLERLKWARPQ